MEEPLCESREFEHPITGKLFKLAVWLDDNSLVIRDLYNLKNGSLAIPLDSLKLKIPKGKKLAVSNIRTASQLNTGFVLHFSIADRNYILSSLKTDLITHADLRNSSFTLKEVKI